MARKEKPVTIVAEGRDHGKQFLLTEMDAAQAEAWAWRAMGAMQRGNVDLPEHVLTSGMAGFAALGLRAFLAAPWSDVQPLLAEMMACVRRLPEDAHTDQATGKPIVRAIVDGDIEEVATLITLRDEVFELHTGFSLAASLFAAVAAATNNRTDSEISSTSEEELQPSLSLD